MAVAELVLEYLNTLIWPAFLTGALYHFRKPIERKIGGLKTFKMGGAEAEFVAAAQEVAIEATEASAQASERQTAEDQGVPATEESPSGAPKELDERERAMERERQELRLIRQREVERIENSFQVLRDGVEIDPRVTVSAAYQFTTNEARAALLRTGGGFAGLSITPLDRAVDLLRTEGLGSEWTQVAWTLTQLADRSGGGEVSAPAALDYLVAASRLATQLATFGHEFEMAKRIREGNV